MVVAVEKKVLFITLRREELLKSKNSILPWWILRKSKNSSFKTLRMTDASMQLLDWENDLVSKAQCNDDTGIFSHLQHVPSIQYPISSILCCCCSCFSICNLISGWASLTEIVPGDYDRCTWEQTTNVHILWQTWSTNLLQPAVPTFCRGSRWCNIMAMIPALLQPACPSFMKNMTTDGIPSCQPRIWPCGVRAWWWFTNQTRYTNNCNTLNGDSAKWLTTKCQANAGLTHWDS